MLWRPRLDVQLSVESWLPEVIVVTAAGQSESASAISHIQSGKLYLYDQGLSGIALIKAHYHVQSEHPVADSQFVVRYRSAGGNSPHLQDAERRPLDELDRAVGVISDRVGRFVSTKPTRHALLDVPLREVLVQYESDGEIKTLRLVTNLLDVSAGTIARLDRHRWQI